MNVTHIEMTGGITVEYTEAIESIELAADRAVYRATISNPEHNSEYASLGDGNYIRQALRGEDQ